METRSIFNPFTSTDDEKHFDARSVNISFCIYFLFLSIIFARQWNTFF